MAFSSRAPPADALWKYLGSEQFPSRYSVGVDITARGRRTGPRWAKEGRGAPSPGASEAGGYCCAVCSPESDYSHCSSVQFGPLSSPGFTAGLLSTLRLNSDIGPFKPGTW